MSILDSSVGLIYSLRADTKDAEKELKRFDAEADKVGKGSASNLNSLTASTGAAGAGFLSMLNPVTLAATAITAVAAASVTVGVTLFELAKQVADLGTEISRFSTLTGLSVETVGALKIASEQAGTSLEEFEEVWESFIEVLIEGGKGAEDAKEKLKLAGIDPQQGFKDLEGSVRKGFDAIRAAGTQAEKSAIAMAVFGESGLSMIKVADSMTGGFDQFKKKLIETGVVMDADGVRKSKEFNQSLAQLTTQAQSVVNQFARELLPVFSAGMRDLSVWFSQNKKTVAEWGTFTANVLAGVLSGFKELFQFIQDHPVLFRVAAAVTTYGASEGIISSVNDLQTIGKNQPSASGDVSLTPKPTSNPSDYLANNDAAEKARQTEIQAQGKYSKALQELLIQDFQNSQAANLKKFQDRGQTAEQYNAAFLANEQKFAFELTRLVSADFDRQAAEEKNKTARQAIRLEQANALGKIQSESAKRIEEANQLIENSEKKVTETKKTESEKRIVLDEKEIAQSLALSQAQATTEIAKLQEKYRTGQILEADFLRQKQAINRKSLEYEAQALVDRFNLIKGDNAKEKELLAERALLLEKLEQLKLEQAKDTAEFTESAILKEIELTLQLIELQERRTAAENERQEKFNKPTAERPDPGTPNAGGGGFLDGILGESVLTSVDEAGNRVTKLSGAFTELKNIAGDALKSMAQGIGNMVQNFVLLGNTGGQSFRKLVVSVLAGVAAQAAVLAVMELAYGIAALTPWGAAIYGSPALHFKAAALFGAIAVTTGLAGRAVAGDSFKQQTGTGASNPATGNITSGRQSTGGAYSGFGDEPKVIEQGANASQGRGGEMVVTINDKTDWFEQMFEMKFRGNGKIRTILNENYGT